ncbi:MAG: O-methyltransferase [bacterium]
MEKTIFEEKLSELEKTQSDFWNIPRVTGELINSLIKSHGFKNILEIGTSNGYSALWIADAVKYTGGKLTGIEFYTKRIVLAEQNLNECGLSEYVNIVQGRALEVLETLDEEYDMVFIDASKAEYIKYYQKIRNQLKQNGLLVADNVDSHREKVQDFMDAIYEDKAFQVSHIAYPAGLLLAFKVGKTEA